MPKKKKKYSKVHVSKFHKLKQDKKILASVVAVFVVLAVGSYVLMSKAAVEQPLFNVTCPVSHYLPDDPIVYPKMPGASHMHSFFANKSTNANTTTQSLLANPPSSCGRGMGPVDLSSYWVPSMYKRNADGTSTQYKGGNYMSVYYRRAGDASGPRVMPFPQGLRMIAGDPNATAAQPRAVAYWQCGAGGTIYERIPLCSGALTSDGVRGNITFPSCWDGKNLDSANHRSHMAYAASSGACPASHPVSLPKIDIELWFPNFSGGSSYFLTSDKSSVGGYSLHADFFAAWENQIQNALVTRCLNELHVCIGIHLTEDRKQLFIDGSEDAITINVANYPANSPYYNLVTPVAPIPTPTPQVHQPTIKTPVKTTPVHSPGHSNTPSTTSPPSTTLTPTVASSPSDLTSSRTSSSSGYTQPITKAADVLATTSSRITNPFILLGTIGVSMGLVCFLTYKLVHRLTR